MSPHDNGAQDDRDATNYAAPPAASTDAHDTRYSDAPADPHATAYTPTADAPDPTAAGRLPRRFGGYELLAELGHGGMGVVYKAREFTPERMVALKVIRAAELATDEDVRLFRQEANEAARLDHPHIVPVYEVGEEDGRHFFTMRLVEGGSLSQHLERYQNDPKAAAKLTATAARAVHYAHQRQLLHRDLKPGNILLDASGQPHVADFGLAKRMGGTGEASQSKGVGTPEYMAPEQARGDARLTTAADVYGLGGVLYALLAARPPFREATSWATIQKVLTEPPPPPSKLRPGVPRDLETICLKCLQKEPGRRYGSAEALAEDLERWLRDEPIKGRPVGRTERAWLWCRRNPAAALLSTAFVTALVVGAAVSTYFAITSNANYVEASNRGIELGKTNVKLMESLASAHYDAARLAMRRGAWRPALEQLDLALEKGYADSAAIHLDKARAWSALHEAPRAKQEIQELSGRQDLDEDLQAQVLLWRADLALNDSPHNEPALRQVKQALDMHLPPAEEAYARGLLAPTSPEAVAFWEQALSKDSYSERANGRLSMLLVLLGRFTEARERIQVGELLFPEDPTFRVLHALMESLDGHAAAAEEQLKLAQTEAHLNAKQAETARLFVRLAGEAPSLPKLFSQDSNTSLLSAVTRIAPLMVQLKIAQLDPAADLYLPVPPVIYEAMKEMPADIGVGTLLFNKGGILRGLDHALEVHPEGMLFLARGMFLGQRDDKESWTKAEQDFLKASQADSMVNVRPQAFYLAAFAEWWLDKTYGPQPEMRQRSLANIRKVLALGGVDAEQYFTLTVMARTMKAPELARRVVDEWARQAPDDPKLPEQQAFVAFEAGEYGRAVTLLNAMLAKKPAAADEKRWRDVRAEAASKLQAQAREIAEVPAK